MQNGRNFVNEALLHGKKGLLELRNYKYPLFPFFCPFLTDFLWGRVNSPNTVMIGGTGAYLPGSGMGHVAFKVNSGTNTLKFTRVGKVTSFYYNGKLERTGTLEANEVQSGTFWLSMDARKSSDPAPISVSFDSIKYTILDKK